MSKNKMGKALGKAFIAGCAVAILAGCESQNNGIVPKDTQVNNSETESESEDTAKDILEKYALSLNNISHSKCDVSVALESNKNGNEFILNMDQENGTLGYGYIEESASLLVVDYDAESKGYLINSYVVDDNDEVTNACKAVKSPSALIMSDLQDSNIFLWDIKPKNDKQSDAVAHLVIEKRADVYTFADGINYSLEIYSINKAGVVKLEYSKDVAGTADEDITSEIRSSFNKYMGDPYYTMDEFEDIFYNGQVIARRESGVEQIAGVELSSYAYAAYKAEYWDNVNRISQSLFSLSGDDTMEWGTVYLSQR